jgi:hypothetical protein
MSLVVIGVYLTIGSLLIFTEYFTIVPEQYRKMAGYVILAYGMLRGVRTFYNQKANAKNE